MKMRLLNTTYKVSPESGKRFRPKHDEGFARRLTEVSPET